MKKFLSLILALLMVLSCASVIFAEEAVTAEAAEEVAEEVTAAPAETVAAADNGEKASAYYDAVAFLVNYGIMHGKGDTLGVFDGIKRYEMALFIGRILTGWVEDSEWEDGTENNSGFVDLAGTAAEKFYGAISFVSNKGIIVGVGANKFAPEAGIKYEDALTMAVRALGYTDLAYPWGYIEKAVALGLTKGITGVAYSEELKREVVAQIIYNALFVEDAEGETLAYKNFGLRLNYENIMITGSDAATYTAQATTAPAGYVCYQVVEADGTLGTQVYTETAEAFGLEGDHADELAIGSIYKALFNKNNESGLGTIVSVESLELDAILNTGDQNKTGGKYPIAAFLADFELVSSFAPVTAFQADDQIIVTAVADSQTVTISNLYAVDWNTGDILCKDNNGVYQVEWYYNALLNSYFQYKTTVKDNGDITLAGINWMTSAEAAALYTGLSATKSYTATNKYAPVPKITNTAYAQLRVFDLDADGVAEYGMYESYKFGKLVQFTGEKLVPGNKLGTITAAGVADMKTKDGNASPYNGNTYSGLAIDGVKDHENIVYGAGNDQSFITDAELAAAGGVITQYHQGQFGAATVADEVKVIDLSNALNGVISADPAFKTGRAYVYTGNGWGGAYKQYLTSFVEAKNVWFETGFEAETTEDGAIADNYVIYGVNKNTGAVKVVETIGAYEEGKETYVATGILRAYSTSKKTLTIGDQTFSYVYDDLAGTAFSTKNYNGYGTWLLGEGYLYDLYNQFVEYVVVDGKIVYIEASGAESERFIIVDSYAGMSSDGYIVINGYDTNNGKLGMFRLASCDGWKFGDFFYYASSYGFDYDTYFEEGTVLEICSYDTNEDAYNVVTIFEDFNCSKSGSTRTYDGYSFNWVKYDFTFAPAKVRVDYKADGSFTNAVGTDYNKTEAGLIASQRSTPNMSADDLYIFVKCRADSLAGSPVVVYQGLVTDSTWSVSGWKLAGTASNVHIFFGVHGEDIVGFERANDLTRGLIVIPTDQSGSNNLGSFELGGNYQTLWTQYLALGGNEGRASSTYEKASSMFGYVGSAAYDSNVEHDDWYLLGNTEYTIRALDLRTWKVITVTADSKDIEPDFIYETQNGKIVGEKHYAEELYSLLIDTYGQAGKIDLENDTCAVLYGSINTKDKRTANAGENANLYMNNNGEGYMWYVLSDAYINKKITLDTYGREYAFLTGKTIPINAKYTFLVAVGQDADGAADLWLCGGSSCSIDGTSVTGAKTIASYFHSTCNKNYAEYPVNKSDNPGVNYADWGQTLSNFWGHGQDGMHDTTISYVSVVNLDNIRNGQNLAMYTSGGMVINYVFDFNEDINNRPGR